MKSTNARRGVLSLSGLLGFVLALTSLSLPGGAFAAESAACVVRELAAPVRPLHFSGKVQGNASPEEVRRETRIAELRTGGAVSPDYVALPRIVAVYVVGGVAHATIAAIVDGHIPHPGETVELASRYRDPRSSCNFIPWTVVPASTPA